jgi:hypothetical protein
VTEFYRDAFVGLRTMLAIRQQTGTQPLLIDQEYALLLRALDLAAEAYGEAEQRSLHKVMVKAPAALRATDRRAAELLANLVDAMRQASPGTWRRKHHCVIGPTIVGSPIELIAECCRTAGIQADRNARFIVAMQNAFPRLLEFIVASRAAIQAGG